MPTGIDVQEAVRRSMQTEKNAMDFYHQASGQMKDAEARRIFELLAREEREHAHWFYDIYPGADIPDFDRFMEKAPDAGSDWLTDLEKSMFAGFNERKALELAMEKELNLEKSLKAMAERIADPEVRRVFEANARSTRHHYELIESEYARLMGMVHETDINTFVRE